MHEQVAEVRSFNRFYTRQIGLLHEHLKSSPYNLSESRLMWEIAARRRANAAELARAMGVDPAFLSRLVAKLSGAGLLAITPSLQDRRQNDIALTESGVAAFAEVNAAADTAVAELLGPLDAMRRQALVGAMRRIHAILDDTRPDATVVLRPHRMGEIGWMIHRQALLYQQQVGWTDAVEGIFAEIYATYISMPADEPKALWVAERAGDIVGSIFVVPAKDRQGTAQLRMLYVEPEVRGLGIGSMLVDHAIAFARGKGYRRMRLLTESVLTSARRIYAKAGFTLVESHRHQTYGKDLEAEYWEMDL